MKVKEFGHIAYRVKDMEVSVKFYTEILGFTKLHEIPTPNGNIVFLELSGKQSLELFCGGEDELKITDKTRGYMHLCIIVEGLKELAEFVASKGIPFYQEPRYAENLSVFRILDPDGNELEILERGADLPF